MVIDINSWPQSSYLSFGLIKESQVLGISILPSFDRIPIVLLRYFKCNLLFKIQDGLTYSIIINETIIKELKFKSWEFAWSTEIKLKSVIKDSSPIFRTIMCICRLIDKNTGPPCRIKLYFDEDIYSFPI
jgi:hypothetical protein